MAQLNYRVHTFWITEMSKDSNNKIWDEPYIRSLYKTVFNRITSYVPAGSKVLIEVGSGNGISKKFLPEIITTDITFHELLDASCDSVALPFMSNSIDVIVVKDTLHHLPDVESFLKEVRRVLRINGQLIVFDPYWGLLARFVYRFLHQEKFDAKAKTWSFLSNSPWDSNQALTYLLLRRDRTKFEEKFNYFKIEEHEKLIGPSFLLSGGVSRRTIISGSFLSLLLNWEMRQSNWLDSLRFFHIFSLTKTS
jgi:SAM-dependent methyltransferase